MEITPIGKRVLIKPKDEEKTSKGIYIPATADESTKRGTVIAVGEAKDMPVNPGDKVMYERHAPIEVTINEEKHIIIDVADIIAKVK